MLIALFLAFGSLLQFKDFPYKPLVYSFRTPDFITIFAHFDGAHYINIAREGYHQFDQAFFPAFPFLIHLLSPLVHGNYLLAGFAIANTASLIGLVLLYQIIAKLYSQTEAWWTIIYLLAFPSGFFFHTVYTEGLFLLLLTGTWWMYVYRETFGATFFAWATSLTRIIGVTSILLFLPSMMDRSVRSGRAFLGIVSGSLLGLGTYCYYLWKTTGDPFMFLTSQSSFNAGRSSSLVLLPQVYFRYAKILVTATHDYAYWIAVSEVLTITLVGAASLYFLCSAYRRQDMNGVGIGLFSLSGLLIPASTGTFLSVSRFSLFCLALYLVLARVSSVKIKYLIAGALMSLQFICFLLFARGYFVA